MKCLAFLITSCLVTSSSIAADWEELSKLNDPPGRPSVLAAKTATQGKTFKQIQTKHKKLSDLLKSGGPHTNGSVRQILTREIQLLEVAMENR